MRFPYWQVQRGPEVRYLPLIPITVHGPTRAALDVLALVDSGAEHTVFGTALAQRLGIPFERGRRVTVVGVGDQQYPGHLVTIRLQLGRNRWSAPTIFSPALEDRAILGQVGFFAFFTVTFRYQKREVEVRRTWKG